MPALDGIPIGDLSPWGLVGLAVLLVLFGRLVPRSTLQREERISDQWREAHMTSEASRAELAQSVHDLLEHAKTTDAFIRSLPHERARSEASEPTQ